MNVQLLVEVSSASVVVPSIAGAIRFKRILKPYRPFIFLMWAGLINESLSHVMIALTHNSSINNNIYTLVDYSIIIWLFMSLDETGNKRKYYFLFAFGALAWFVDNILLLSIKELSSFFRIIYGLIVVFLSVGKLNSVLFTQVRKSLKNAALVICIAFIIGYTYQAVLEVFGAIKLPFTREFYVRLYLILIYLNILTNLLYALAIVWVPTRRQFTLPYL